MPEIATTQSINEFLGSVAVLSSAIEDSLKQRLREAVGDELTYSQLELLKLVAFTDGHTIGNVAAFLGISNAAASKAVDRLVRRNLVRREAAENDRRVVELSPTDEGQKLLAKFEGHADQSLERVVRDISPQELRRLARVLDLVSVNLVLEGNGRGEFCFRCGIHFRDRCLLREFAGRKCYFHLHHKGGGSPRRGTRSSPVGSAKE